MTAIVIGFVATVVAVAAAIAWIGAIAARRAGRRPGRAAAIAGGAIAAWLAITGGAAAAGLLALDGGPPRVLALPWLAIIGAIVALRSEAGRALVAAAPRTAVMALQVFRVPVELVLWGLFTAGTLPVQMTFEGRNLDVLTGLTAIPVALAAWGGGRSRPALAIAWHVGGAALLLNIVTIAVLSTPGPLRVFTAAPANTIIGTLPFVWLPAFLVPVAMVGHIVGIAQALAARRARDLAAEAPC